MANIVIDPYEDPSRKGGSIQTFTGHVIYPLDPREEDIFLEDVAHALANKARFTGHTRKFYSSGEHAVRVSWALKELGASLMTQYVGLHHDDSDAFLPDVPTPLKVLPEFAWFRELEYQHQDLCFKRFGCIVLGEEDYYPVKKADVILLLTEKRDLMPRRNSNWDKKYQDKYGVTAIPPPYVINPWPPGEAKALYLERNKELADALLQSYPGFRCNGLEADSG